MAPHSSTLAWKTPWIEEPGGLQSIGSQRVRHNLGTEHAHKHLSEEEDKKEEDVSSSLKK